MRHGIRGAVLLALIALAGLTLAACGSDDKKATPLPPTQSPTTALSVGDQAPAFTLPTANGGTVSLADYQGKQPVLLFFHMAQG